MPTVVWFCIVWFCTSGSCPAQGVVHVFNTVESCQEWRTNYINTHPDDPSHWAISRCKPKEIE